MPFREPLDGKLIKMDPIRLTQARSLFDRPGPVSVMAHQQGPLIQNEELEYFKKSGLLVIGELSPNTDRAPIKSMVEKLEWPVFLDVLSGLKYDFSMKDGAIPTFDHPEIIEYFNENKPEVIVHIGGRMTSKFYHHFLESNPQIKILHVTPKISKNMAPSSADYTRESEPSAWASRLLECLEIKNKRSDFETKRWTDFVERKRKLIDESDLCYPQISKTLIENLPPSCDLYLGNSTVIRSFDSYTGFDSYSDIRTIGHRGVSGIEGFIAAAQGLRESDEHGPVILVLGDISFLHDLNSLMLLNENDRPILIVLVNNFGGGIFSLLPLEKGEEILPWMCTPHEIVFENISKSFHLKYDQCTDKFSFVKVIHEFKTQTSGVRVVELLVDNNKNTEVYQKLKTVRL